MVEDNYIYNKLESITITSGNSIIFDRGNINSSVDVSSTKSVILGIIFKLYLFNNAHTRSIGMFLVLLNNFDETIKSGNCANRFYNYSFFALSTVISILLSVIFHTSAPNMVNSDTVYSVIYLMHAFQESSFKFPVQFCAVFQVLRQSQSDIFLFHEFFQWYDYSPKY